MSTILDVESLRRAVTEGREFTYRFFWGHKSPPGTLTDHVFSQWWPARFVVKGVTYSTAEQFMMAGKARLFGDEGTLAEILAENDPAKVKALGRKVRGFEHERWDDACFDLVTRGNVAKFGDDPRLKGYLLATGDEVLVEASPVDRVWGIGLAVKDARASDPQAWQGENLLGFALMRARAILRGELPSIDG